ncbi:MAG: ATP-binding cassette domain-containing protein [Tannerella sp.]|jgi:molybdate transport system ATP-binding protein|nr:ATP-binding cassette domain-containing protein [Tannerella sp.]
MNPNRILVSFEQAVPRLAGGGFGEPLQWDIREGEQWAVIGPNGSGKTMLADILRGRYFLKEGRIHFGDGMKNEYIQCIAFKDIHSLTDCRNVYYQQRWHATETDELPCAGELLSGVSSALFDEMDALFNIRAFLPKKIIHLSSGELRKFLIIRTLLSDPQILILDNPFIGLDAASRDVLMDMLKQTAKRKGLQVILLLSNPSDIPEMITHVLPVASLRCLATRTREEFLADKETQKRLFPSHPVPGALPVSGKQPSYHTVTFRMEQVSIHYGKQTILKDINWEVKNGESWALCGPNGSGKSLLLSLIYADNPQSYAQTLYLFDRKRGTGESIWDIKQRIGYVSPEMHLYFMENVPAIEIVCSGFYDSIGLFRKYTGAQKETAAAWMQALGIESFKDRSFLTLSSGEQRLVLLARAFVKDPDLLILDEPLHGLDVSNKQRISGIIEAFCKRKGKTLVYVTHYLNELPPCITHRFDLVKMQACD